MSHQPAEASAPTTHVPWNKGKLTGQKRPFTLKQIWEIRIRLQIADRTRDLALFNLGVDSKLRGCDLVRLRISDVAHGDQILSRAKVIQKKTGRPVSFELTAETRRALLGWITKAELSAGDFLFYSRIDRDRHLTTRQYARLVHEWVSMIGADPSEYGTHSLRRSKATLIYRQTKNLRAVQLLLGHTKLESTLRYLGVEVDDALEIAEHTEIGGHGVGAASRRLAAFCPRAGLRCQSELGRNGLPRTQSLGQNQKHPPADSVDWLALINPG